MAGLEGASAGVQQHGPLSAKTERAKQAHPIVLRSGAVLRPHRTSAVGVPTEVAPADKTILNCVRAINAPLKFYSPCPNTQFPPSRTRCMKCMHAATYLEARELGATQADIEWG